MTPVVGTVGLRTLAGPACVKATTAPGCRPTRTRQSAVCTHARDREVPPAHAPVTARRPVAPGCCGREGGRRAQAQVTVSGGGPGPGRSAQRGTRLCRARGLSRRPCTAGEPGPGCSESHGRRPDPPSLPPMSPGLGARAAQRAEEQDLITSRRAGVSAFEDDGIV